jgi:hypothetical protein
VLVLTLIPFIGWSPFWFVIASVLLAGRFALHRPFATLVPETDSELANFLLRGGIGKHPLGRLCRAPPAPGRIYRLAAIIADPHGRICRILSNLNTKAARSFRRAPLFVSLSFRLAALSHS